jgi:hypothetical protein
MIGWIVFVGLMALWFIPGYLAARAETKYNNYIRHERHSDKVRPLDAVLRKFLGGIPAFFMQAFALNYHRQRIMREMISVPGHCRIFRIVRIVTYKAFGVVE